METTVLMNEETKNNCLAVVDKVGKPIGIILSLCGGKVIDDILETLLPAQAKPFAKLVRKIGAYAISGLVYSAMRKSYDVDISDLKKMIEEVAEIPLLEEGESDGD